MIKVISGREYPKQVIPLIERSKKTIDTVVFDWRWYSNDSGAICQLFNQAIIRASRRGVKIRAIANNDKILGILRTEGCEAVRLRTKKLVHSKLMIIDEEIVITGSHNYTQSAFQKNLELSVIIHEDPINESFKLFFNNIWSLK